jgi:hypothetical protein
MSMTLPEISLAIYLYTSFYLYLYISFYLSLYFYIYIYIYMHIYYIYVYIMYLPISLAAAVLVEDSSLAERAELLILKMKHENRRAVNVCEFDANVRIFVIELQSYATEHD